MKYLKYSLYWMNIGNLFAEQNAAQPSLAGPGG